METLRKKQSRFVESVAFLIVFAKLKGYELTFGDAYRDPRCGYGHPESLHQIRLAVDFNLFREGVYLTSTEDHRPLGEFWESLGHGHRWGGRFADGNHYSIEHEGRK